MRTAVLAGLTEFMEEQEAVRCNRASSKEELWEALKALPNGKSPSKDGLPKEFFVKCWRGVKQRTLEMANQASADGSLPAQLNVGLIKLIPKNAIRLNFRTTKY